MADFDETAGKEQEAIFRAKGLDVTFVQVDVVDRESVDTISGKNN